MTPSQRQTWIRKQVRILEGELEEQRKQQGCTVLGFKKLSETDPRDRPQNPKKSGKEPLCHCSDAEDKKMFKAQWKYFMNQFIPASADYRTGMRDRDFPVGSFKPPLFDISLGEDP